MHGKGEVKGVSDFHQKIRYPLLRLCRALGKEAATHHEQLPPVRWLYSR